MWWYLCTSVGCGCFLRVYLYKYIFSICDLYMYISIFQLFVLTTLPECASSLRICCGDGWSPSCGCMYCSHLHVRTMPNARGEKRDIVVCAVCVCARLCVLGHCVSLYRHRHVTDAALQSTENHVQRRFQPMLYVHTIDITYIRTNQPRTSYLYHGRPADPLLWRSADHTTTNTSIRGWRELTLTHKAKDTL